MERERERERERGVEETWGPNLLYNPRQRNDCFFESLAMGLRNEDESGAWASLDGKQLRNVALRQITKKNHITLEAVPAAWGCSP